MVTAIGDRPRKEVKGKQKETETGKWRIMLAGQGEAIQRKGRWERLTTYFHEVKRMHSTLISATYSMWAVATYCLRLTSHSCFHASSLQLDCQTVQHRGAKYMLRLRHRPSWHRRDRTHFKYTVNCGVTASARTAKVWVLLKDKLAFSHIQSDILIPLFK